MLQFPIWMVSSEKGKSARKSVHCVAYLVHHALCGVYCAALCTQCVTCVGRCGFHFWNVSPFEGWKSTKKSVWGESLKMITRLLSPECGSFLWKGVDKRHGKGQDDLVSHWHQFNQSLWCYLFFCLIKNFFSFSDFRLKCCGQMVYSMRFELI